MNRAIRELFAKAIRFVRRQRKNFKVTVTRYASHNFLYYLTFQYDSIYTVALGANPVQLGSLSGIGESVGAAISTPAGWAIDKYSLKKIYLLGIGLWALVSAIYSLAWDWTLIILAMILFSAGRRLTGSSCSVVCADSLESADRATGKALCNAISSIPAMVSPMVAAFLVTVFGGINVDGIRPLYHIRVVGYCAMFLFVATQLTEPAREVTNGSKPSFIRDFKELFAHGVALKRWVIVSSVAWFPYAMITPFMLLFAYEAKGADQFVLGGMTAAMTFVPLLVGIPIGRLADKVGRKKALYLIAPLCYASSLLLVFGRSPVALIASGAFYGFYMVSFIVAGAMSAELVPICDMGKWSGVLGLFRGLINVPAPIIGGVIWGELNPACVFLIPIAIDLLMRLPLLYTIPETLSPRIGG